MIEELRRRNKLLLISSDKKQMIIAKILKKENFIHEINMETAYALLRDLGFEEKELNIIYQQLMIQS